MTIDANTHHAEVQVAATKMIENIAKKETKDPNLHPLSFRLRSKRKCFDWQKQEFSLVFNLHKTNWKFNDKTNFFGKKKPSLKLKPRIQSTLYLQW